MKQDRKELSEHQTGGTDRADAGMPVHRKWPWQKLWTKQSTSSCWLCELWQKAAAVGDQEGTCQLGWEVLHRWVRKVQTHQNLRHCQNNVFVSSTRLRSKLWKCDTVKCCLSQTLSSLPAHWCKTAPTLKGVWTGKHKEETSGTWEPEREGASVGQRSTAMVNPGIRKGNSKVRPGTVRLKICHNLNEKGSLTVNILYS